ncbi:MAG: hypothetical protein GY885_14275 [Phycisphaeraceae bacterium]|nr:hypothetical protein [Phycisphaeraceae bacterium]
MHPMPDQPATDRRIDRVASGGDTFPLARSRAEPAIIAIRRIGFEFGFGLGEGDLVRDSLVRLEIVRSRLGAGGRLQTPSGEQSILTLEAPATDDQLIDRFLDPFDFGAT